MLVGAWNKFRSFFHNPEDRKRSSAQCDFSDDSRSPAKRRRSNENNILFKDRIRDQKMAGFNARTPKMKPEEPDVIIIDENVKEVKNNNLVSQTTKELRQSGFSKENNFAKYQGNTKLKDSSMRNKAEVVFVPQRNFSSSIINGARPKIRNKYYMNGRSEKCNGELKTPSLTVFDTIFSKGISKAEINGHCHDKSTGSFELNNSYTSVNQSMKINDKEAYRDLINRFSNTAHWPGTNSIKIEKLNRSVGGHFKRRESNSAIPVIDLTCQSDRLIRSPEVEIVEERSPASSFMQKSKLPNSKLYTKSANNGFQVPVRRNIETITIPPTPKKQILQDRKLELDVSERSREGHKTGDRLGDYYLYESRYLKENYFAKLKNDYDSSNKIRGDQINEQLVNVKKLEEKRLVSLQDRIKTLYSFENLKTIIEEEPFPELTPEILKKVNDAFMVKNTNEILVEAFNYSIRRKDMETLKGLNWLNDEIINFYFTLLMERGKLDNFLSVYSFTTFFYPKLMSSGHDGLKRWTRKVDLFSHDLILIPVHLGMHWCLAVVNFKRKVIEYYDSMGGKNQKCLEEIRKYLEREHQVKKNARFDFSDWNLENIKDIPQQMNGSDCGMFACKYAEYVSRNVKITFKQEDMPYFRKRMAYEIMTVKLM